MAPAIVIMAAIVNIGHVRESCCLKAVMLDDTGMADEGEAELATTAPIIAPATARVIVCLFIVIVRSLFER